VDLPLVLRALARIRIPGERGDMAQHDDERDEVHGDFTDAVNMTPKELEEWLATDESKSVGDRDDAESTGHRMGRRILDIKATKKADLTDDDIAAMRKVVGYVARHTKQRPSHDVETSRWRYSLMNWGHDPLKS
jgi:hypothetical protein